MLSKQLKRTFSAALCCVFCAWGSQAIAQQSASTKPSPKLEAASQTAEMEKPEVSLADLMSQGKALYRTAKFKQALTRFEAALKLESENDEALGMAAETAFRLDSQAAARDYFMRRAELRGQRDSVKAYCFHRVAMTYWREAHDVVAKYAEMKDGKIVYDLPEGSQSEVMDDVDDGIKYAKRAISVRSSFADAYNIRNLLNAEAALATTNEKKAKEYRQKSLDDLRMALSFANPAAEGKAAEAADFNYPTIRISEFPRTKEEQGQIADEMMKVIEGGRPIRQVRAVFPSIRPPKPSGDPSAGGADLPDKVKVEVLVSTEGKVIFTHIIDGRSDLNGAAIVAARAWKFEPARFDGQPVQISGVISFDLKPSRPKSPSVSPAIPPKKP